MTKNKVLKVFATGLSVAMLTMALVGCSGKTNKETSSEVQGETKVGMDAKTLTLATGAELTTLYPLNMDPQNNCATKLVYEGLVNYNKGEIEPCLAESWEFNEKGTELTLHLKKNVKFHDGADFNAEAVKKNLEYYHTSPNHRLLAVADLVKVEVVDAYTLKLHYDHPYFAYLNDLCYPEVLIMVSPNAIEEENFQTMKGVVGTGPYVYKEIKEGEYVSFTKNENYWGETPCYDEVIEKYIPESASRLQALQNGEVDILYGNALVSYDDYEQAIAMNGIGGKIAEVNSETRNLAVNTSSQMLSDLKIREAIAYAIDKQGISAGLTYQQEEVAEQLFSNDIPYTNVKLKTVRSFNEEKANSLLEEAGWILNDKTGIREKEGKLLKITFTYDSGEVLNKALAMVIKNQLKEVGIEVETVGQDMYTWWTEGVAGKYDLTIWNTEQPYTAPHNFFTPMLGSSPHTPAIAALKDGEDFKMQIKAFSTTDDKAKVTQIFDYLINYSNDNVLNIPLTYVKDMIVYNTDKIADYHFTSTPMFFDVRQVQPQK